MFLTQMFYKLLNFLSPCSQRKKMSSMYLYHRYFNSAITNILCSGTNFVPITVPRFCFKFFSLKVQILFLRTTLSSSTSVRILTSFSCLKSSCLRRADKPSSCGMLEYKPTTSTVHHQVGLVKSGVFSKNHVYLLCRILLLRPKVGNESLKKKICFQYNNRSLK